MKKYIKLIDGKEVIKPQNQIVVVREGKQYINPSESVLLADGWALYEPVKKVLSEEELAAQEAASAAESARGFLTDSDYKVIKCIEAYLCGEALPYDIAELHKEREAYRKVINENE